MGDAQSMYTRRGLGTLPLIILALASPLWGHQVIENALDVVIYRDKVVVDARISIEEVIAMEAETQSPPPERWKDLAAAHEAYVLGHLKIEVDGTVCRGKRAIEPDVMLAKSGPLSELSRATYRFEYTLPNPPHTVRIHQDLLRERRGWQCLCVARVRQSDQQVFQSALLSEGRYIEFDCDWNQTRGSAMRTAPTTSPAAVGTEVRVWPTIGAYVRYGILHILKGFDHLLFVSALVLAARGLWDLIKVVTAFTIAHTLTLTLSVLNVVTLSERIVEPMIAASIVFVALQNLFWPKQARGWPRLAIAFAFGLFHGLGFAGGLKEAMSEMPVLALGLALAAFSIGVEIGHQVVVLPLFALLKMAREWRASEDRAVLSTRILKIGSAAISIAGLYFLIQKIR